MLGCSSLGEVPDGYFHPRTFQINSPPNNPGGWSSVANKVPATLPTTGRRLLIYATGQSNSGNVDASPYTPVNPDALFNINFFDGKVFKLSDPILGAGGTGASFITILSDLFVSAGYFDSVTVMHNCIGATTSTDWSPTGTCYPRIRHAVRQVQLSGFQPTNRIVCLHQGESDTAAGNIPFRTQLNALQGTLTEWSSLEPSAIQFIGLVSFFAGNTNSVVRNARAALINNRTRFSFGDFDVIPCSGRGPGCIDYNTAGNVQAADIAFAAIENYLLSH